MTNKTGNGEYFGIYEPAGNVSEGFWIGITTVDGNNPITSPRYWTDKPDVYLKDGDYGYTEPYFLGHTCRMQIPSGQLYFTLIIMKF